MPKLKRSPDDTRNTDVIESLDRGLRVFELFPAVTFERGKYFTRQTLGVDANGHVPAAAHLTHD